MLKGLIRYATDITKIFFLGKIGFIVRDKSRYFFHRKDWLNLLGANAGQAEESLDRCISWLMVSTEKMKDDGMGSFSLAGGWSASYPETTGYIIPTLLEYSRLSEREDCRDAALRSAHWLVSIQRKSGGWQGGRVNEQKPEIVFNTGQILRGLLAAYRETKNEVYMSSLIRGADWLCDIQHPDGYWKDYALMNAARVYDSFVSYPLLMVWKETGDEKYRDHAVRNLEWIVRHKQKSNGWFEDCDNTMKHNNRPILHTIAYTIEGLLDSGLLLNNREFIEAAEFSAQKLEEIFKKDGFLPGRFDEEWKGSEHPILTGMAQMSNIWLKLHREGIYGSYYDSAAKMIHQLIWLQDKRNNKKKNTYGAIPGSFPVWGRYEPFAYPNWAVKFFADALMLFRKASAEEK